MKILILTIVIEILAVATLFLDPREVGKRKRKIIVILSNLVFFGMAGIFHTVFLPTEIFAYAAGILFKQTTQRMNYMKAKGIIEPEKTRKIDKKVTQIVILLIFTCLSILIEVMFFYANFEYSLEECKKETVQLEVPDDINAILPKFVTLHDSKTETYKFYWTWKNGIYKVDEISSKDAYVFADFGDDEMPYYEKTTKIQYKMNCNFWWEDSKVVGEKIEYKYKVYVPEYSLKEFYTFED